MKWSPQMMEEQAGILDDQTGQIFFQQFRPELSRQEAKNSHIRLFSNALVFCVLTAKFTAS